MAQRDISWNTFQPGDSDDCEAGRLEKTKTKVCWISYHIQKVRLKAHEIKTLQAKKDPDVSEMALEPHTINVVTID